MRARILRWTQRRAGIGAFSTGRRLIARERYADAAAALEDAERLLGRQYGPRHDWVGQSVAKRAWCYAKMGRFDEAISLYELAIDIEDEQDHPDAEWMSELREQLDWARSNLDNGPAPA
jgi:tetratricopeptide (TPR) repeat protein